MRRFTAAGALAIFCLLGQASAVLGDALYPAASDGTWTGDTNPACDSAPWTSPQWGLWSITGQGVTYIFDIPNPTLVPDETLTIKLAPIVAGTIPGSVRLIGTDTVTVHVPAQAGWAMLTPEPFLQLAYQPGGSTAGTVSLPSEWVATFTGFLGIDAQLTGDRGTNTHIAILAQGLRPCPPPNTSTELNEPRPDGQRLLPVVAGLVAFLLVLRRRNLRA